MDKMICWLHYMYQVSLMHQCVLKFCTQKLQNLYQYGARTGPHKTHKPDKIGCFRVHYVLAKLFNNRLLRMSAITPVVSRVLKHSGGFEGRMAADDVDDGGFVVTVKVYN
ncbi:hypothetical protein Hdeb2414_s0238g00844321 [Helianthus debilis subsp. tardiflorus]